FLAHFFHDADEEVHLLIEIALLGSLSRDQINLRTDIEVECENDKEQTVENTFFHTEAPDFTCGKVDCEGLLGKVGLVQTDPAPEVTAKSLAEPSSSR